MTHDALSGNRGSDNDGLALRFKERKREFGYVTVGVFVGERDGSRPCVGELKMGEVEWDRLVGGGPVGGQPMFRRMASWGPNFGGDAPNQLCLWFSEPYRAVPVIPATEDHPAIYQEGHRLTASPKGSA
jgi:hypothetical protein